MVVNIYALGTKRGKWKQYCPSLNPRWLNDKIEKREQFINPAKISTIRVERSDTYGGLVILYPPRVPKDEHGTVVSQS